MARARHWDLTKYFIQTYMIPKTLNKFKCSFQAGKFLRGILRQDVTSGQFNAIPLRFISYFPSTHLCQRLQPADEARLAQLVQLLQLVRQYGQRQL